MYSWLFVYYQIRHQLQRDYDELKTQEAIFTLNKMAHLTGISSDIFDMNQSDDCSASADSEGGEGLSALVFYWY